MSYLFEFKKLGVGVHNQKYIINDKFFEQFENSDIQKANVVINLTADIKSSVISLLFEIKGTVEVQCDVCLENFDFKISNKTDLFIRFSERAEFGEADFEDDNKITLSKATENIDLTKHFYDFIVLSLPIKKVHPLDKKGNRTCNPDFLEKLEEYESQNTLKNDPRWDELKKLLN
ncbi:MAG: DUF177 domain-containing protein [Bacteroidales bacterium]|nr:DUF177 domain-containing protein [Bacteroidales bacterium]